MMEDQLEVLGNLHLQSSLPGPFTYARNFPDHCRNTTNSSMKHFWHCFRSTPCAFICIERMTYTYIANPGFFFEFYSGKISMAANVLPDLVLSRSLTHWTGARNIASSIWAEKSSEHIRISNQCSHSWSWELSPLNWRSASFSMKTEWVEKLEKFVNKSSEVVNYENNWHRRSSSSSS